MRSQLQLSHMQERERWQRLANGEAATPRRVTGQALKYLIKDDHAESSDEDDGYE